MAGLPGSIRGQNSKAESREWGKGLGARALYLMPPAEEASGVDVGVRLVFIVRHLDVVPHAVVHHLASGPSPPGLWWRQQRRRQHRDSARGAPPLPFPPGRGRPAHS